MVGVRPLRRLLLGRSLLGRLLLVSGASVFAARVGAAATALELETGSPDALCPDLTMTREAVSRRLGTLVTPAGAGWKARYTIGHAPEGTPRDFVRLELFGPDGALQLARDLPLEASCATMADVIALVLDRHFRGLPVHAEPRPSEPREAAPELARDTPLPSPAAAAAGENTARAPLVVGVELSARYPVLPGAGLRLAAELHPDIYLGAALSAALVPEKEELERGGSVELSSFNLQGHAGWGPRLGALRTHVGPSFRLMLDRGSAQGLPEVDTRYRVVPAAGLHAGAIGNLSGRTFWTASFALDWSIRALSGRFVIEEREVLRPRRMQAWAGIGVGYAL